VRGGVGSARRSAAGLPESSLVVGQGIPTQGVSGSGDVLAHRERWKEKEVVPVRGFLKLHFFLKKAGLFNLQFIDSV